MKSKGLVYILITFLSISSLLSFVSFSIGVQGSLKTSQGTIFDGLHADYTFISGVPEVSTITYEHDVGDLYNVTWNVNNSAPGWWQEDTETRLTSNVGGFGPSFGNGEHTPFWVFTNLTLGDTVPIAVDGIGDYDYNVTKELTFNYPGVGNVDIWVLEQFIWPSSIVWYEKTTGLLLNGTFISFIGEYDLILTDTNMFAQPAGGIPGYNIFVFIPLVVIITLVSIRMKKRKTI